MGSRSGSPEPDRAGSVRALAAKLDARVVAGESLETVLASAPSPGGRDAALLRALVSGSLRWHHRLEWQIGHLLERPLKPRDRLLGALLRVGLFQLERTRIPDHAAVSATVDAAREIGLPQAAGLVNAVLRRYLRERERLERDLERDETARFSHPAWLIRSIEEDWPEDWSRILEANNEPPPMWLRVNRLKLSREGYMQLLERTGLAATGSARAVDAVRLAEPRPVADVPGFRAGQVSVQDAAAQLAAGLLELGAGQRVLDACAAPGGKTAHMLEACPELAEVVAIDRDRGRLDRVAENLDRLELAARLVHADAADVGEWWDGEPFDRILLDAPCSAVGVIRRHPDIKLLRRADDIEALALTQTRLLDALWPLLKPGGLLVYATCSVLAKENTRRTGTFSEDHTDASLPPPGTARHFQVLPGEADMDGFYYACVTKSAERKRGHGASG